MKRIYGQRHVMVKPVKQCQSQGQLRARVTLTEFNRLIQTHEERFKPRVATRQSEFLLVREHEPICLNFIFLNKEKSFDDNKHSCIIIKS